MHSEQKLSVVYADMHLYGKQGARALIQRGPGVPGKNGFVAILTETFLRSLVSSTEDFSCAASLSPGSLTSQDLF